jgi:putative redox protein
MKHSVDCAWNGNMKFTAGVDGHEIVLDASPEVRGENLGPRPKTLMLAALAGCTAMDVISLLKKMRVEVEDFHVAVDGELSEEIPKYYQRMHVIYTFKGKELPMDKLQKAVDMSRERYCGVSHFYRKLIEVTFEIRVL